MGKRGQGGWGVKPYYADLNEEERKAMRQIAADRGLPVGVIVGEALRAYYAAELKDKIKRNRTRKNFKSSGLRIDQIQD